MSPTLLVVAKAPVPGLAKTRMSPPLSPEHAADVAAAALLDTLDAVAAVPDVRRVVAMTGELARACRRVELARSLARFTVVPQRGAGFAERLVHAHADCGPGPVLQIGMDTPQVGAEQLAAALDALAGDGVDAVLGPAADGGWWALGVRRPELAAVLGGVVMSTPETGRATRAALRATGARVVTLETVADVDTVADALAVAATARGTRFAQAVATAVRVRAQVGR